MNAIHRNLVQRSALVAVALSLFGAMLFWPVVNQTARADDVGSRQAPVDEKLAAAKEWHQAAQVAFDAGTIRISDLYDASLAWKEAAAEAAATRQARIRAIEAHRDRINELAKYEPDLEGSADRRAREAMCRYWVLEAKIWIAEETARK
jgi:hypothetical protein